MRCLEMFYNFKDYKLNDSYGINVTKKSNVTCTCKLSLYPIHSASLRIKAILNDLSKCRICSSHIGGEKSSTIWDTMPCGPLNISHLVETCRLHLQGRCISQARTSLKQCSKLYPSFLLGLFFDPEDGNIPRKRRLTFNGLHGVITQITEVFDLRTLKPRPN
jgi:hypothetical protein